MPEQPQLSRPDRRPTAEIRVLVVDDHAILRDGICSLLAQQADIQVVGEAGNGREALEKVSALKPDLVLMDIAMPEMNGIEATRQIKQRYPEVIVMILTQHDNREYIEPVLRAGASGYVLKRSGGRELVSAIRQVVQQGAFLEPSVARQVLSSFSEPNDAQKANRDAMPAPAGNTSASRAPEIDALTSREIEVLKLLSEGHSNKEIAHLLSISPKTVSVHRSNVMRKLDLQSSFELIRYVTQNQIFTNQT